jgi:nucleoside-diphosphate-sugar epimerase
VTPKRIAITGASGFVGRHLVRAAASAGLEPVGYVRSERAAALVREAGGAAVPFAEEPAALARSLEGAVAVVHLAQIGSERGGQTYEAVNVGLTARVVDAARQAEVERFVMFSGLGVARYGQSRRVTSRYFLSKLTAETLAFGSGLDVAVFRPSYVVGPGDAFVPTVLRAMQQGEVERPGDGSYRMQPIAVADAAAAVLAAVSRPPRAFPTVFDLVGPEPVAYARLLERLEAVARREGRAVRLRVREVPIDEAERLALSRAGYQGMGPDELDCLLCDEVADHAPLERLLARPLLPLDEALAAAVRSVHEGA